MTLENLTSADAVIRSIREFDELGREGFLTKYGFGEAQRYFLTFEGHQYDSKAIAGAAHGHQHPSEGPLRASDFSGGETTVAKRLRRLGFNVVSGDPPSKSVFGEIAGVSIGTLFATRMDLSRARVHRPTQAGISGTPREGADSIVLSGGYEDDRDEGDVIIYTGHGGRDPESRKQVRDQELTRQNLALKVSQTNGLPVRVVRGPDKGSSFAPPSGYRYDGLYRVQDCWTDVGRAGFKVIRFTLARIRDEAVTPAPPPAGQEPTGPAARRPTTVLRVVRDTALGRQVKSIYDFTCQICGLRLEGPGTPYAEAAHIRPLGRPHDGPDVLSNLLCLCPNHHVLFDLGAFTIREDLSLDGIPGRVTVAGGHSVDDKHLRYRRDHYSKLAGNPPKDD